MYPCCASARRAVLTRVNCRVGADATMAAMQFWHAHRALARGILLWFLLTLGSAIAAPWLSAAPVQQWVCSAGGVMRMVQPADDGSLPVQLQGLECPLCASSAAPPPVAQVQALPLLGTSSPGEPGWRDIAAARLPAPSARGPPGA